jgi:hypothetical protein
MGDMRNVDNVLVGKPERKRPLGTDRYRLENNNIMNVRETGWEGMGWMNLAQDMDQRQALVNMVMNLWVP